MKLIEFTQFLLRGFSPPIMIAFILSHIMFQGDLFSHKKTIKDRLYLTLIFGMISIAGSLFALYDRNIYIDTAVLVVIVAGLKGGIGVGLGSGVIGAIFRVVTFPPSGKFIIVTLIAGLLGGIMSHLSQEKDNIRMEEGFLVGAMVGILQAFIVPWAAPENIPEKNMILPLTIPFLLVNGFSVCIYLFIMRNLEAWHEKQKAEELRTKAQLRLLQSQIKPHFLFNALNTIASFSRTNPDKTRLLIQSLSEFLRITLKTNKSNITLKEELENLDFYLEIEKARFGERLEFRKEVDQDLMSIEVPFMSLQPLVENSIKHGFLPDGRKLTINLRVEKENNGIIIEISDNGKGMEKGRLKEIINLEKEREGIGFQNVIKRMKNKYGPDSRVDVGSIPDKGTKIKFYLPVSITEKRGGL